jgi:N-carbamoylputrescine amidase
MRIAFLHLDLSGGPEKRNLDLLAKATGLAAGQGANWIVTPEVAVQGYFFAQEKTDISIPEQPDQSLQPIRQLAAKYKLTVFLGCAEQDAGTGKYYNSCLVIGPEGNVLGSHRKTRSHGVGAEAWVTAGDKLEPVSCPEMKAGIMICADSWFVDKAKVLKDKGAEVLTVLAAWPPGHYGPGDCWERCSQVSGLPVWVCNQTGNQEALDFSEAQSVVVAAGKTQFSYSGLQQAVLLFDWDCKNNCAAARQFTVLALN